MVRTLSADGDDPLLRASLALAAGQVIAHPTETVFGLAVDPFHPAAMARLLELKGGGARKGFILLIPDPSWLPRLITPPAPLARTLMERFWPGPLTLVLPARSGLPVPVTGGSGWVALRHSSSPLVAGLMRLWQKPLASTSANPGGQPTACSAAAVRRQWGGRIAVVLEGEVATEAQPSTLLQVADDRVYLLREGALALAYLQATLPELRRCMVDPAHTPTTG
ncbi:MAG: L-threonylcarbamoyladenylate synthase [Magnetococcus sp. MYC-9]